MQTARLLFSVLSWPSWSRTIRITSVCITGCVRTTLSSLRRLCTVTGAISAKDRSTDFGFLAGEILIVGKSFWAGHHSDEFVFSPSPSVVRLVTRLLRADTVTAPAGLGFTEDSMTEFEFRVNFACLRRVTVLPRSVTVVEYIVVVLSVPSHNVEFAFVVVRSHNERF